MAGTIKVDQVQSDSNLSFNLAGSNVAYLNATSLQLVSSNISLAGTNVFTSGKLVTSAQPVGAVLQVVQSQLTSGQSTTSTSLVTSNLSGSITPISTSSKILIYVTGGKTYVAGASNILLCTMYRNGSTLGVAATWCPSSDTNGNGANHGFSYLDSPSSTSSVTYTPYYRSVSGGIVYFNDGAGTYGYTNMILMEIAA